jgi:hypothetical protein
VKMLGTGTTARDSTRSVALVGLRASTYRAGKHGVMKVRETSSSFGATWYEVLVGVPEAIAAAQAGGRARI